MEMFGYQPHLSRTPLVWIKHEVRKEQMVLTSSLAGYAAKLHVVDQPRAKYWNDYFTHKKLYWQ